MASSHIRLLSLISAAFWQQKLGAWRARWFDFRHGLETGEVVPVAEMTDIGPDLAVNAVQYEPSSLAKFHRAMSAVNIDYASYTFVDFGSGKGRVLLLAAQLPFQRVIGVEMSRVLHEAAGANIAAYLSRTNLAAPISRVCADARELAVPAGNLLAYFYNPFSESVMREVWAGICLSRASRSSSLVVIYVNPAHRKVFDEAPELHSTYDDKAVVVYCSRDSK